MTDTTKFTIPVAIGLEEEVIGKGSIEPFSGGSRIEIITDKPFPEWLLDGMVRLGFAIIPANPEVRNIVHKHYLFVACKTFVDHPTWVLHYVYEPEKVTCPECLELLKKIKEEE